MVCRPFLCRVAVAVGAFVAGGPDDPSAAKGSPRPVPVVLFPGPRLPCWPAGAGSCFVPRGPRVPLPLHGRVPEDALVGASALLLLVEDGTLTPFGVNAQLQV